MVRIPACADTSASEDSGGSRACSDTSAFESSRGVGTSYPDRLKKSSNTSCVWAFFICQNLTKCSMFTSSKVKRINPFISGTLPTFNSDFLSTIRLKRHNQLMLCFFFLALVVSLIFIGFFQNEKEPVFRIS